MALADLECNMIAGVNSSRFDYGCDDGWSRPTRVESIGGQWGLHKT